MLVFEQFPELVRVSRHMFLLFTDETNFDPSTSDFFVYGGLIIPGERALALSDEIDQIRTKYSYGPLDPLKFTAHGRPSHITNETHVEVKRDILEAAARYEVKLLVSVILHSIATSPEDARLKELNRVCFHFNCYLTRKKDCGIVLIDNFRGPKLLDFLREKFGVGLTRMPYSRTLRLKKIVGFHLSHIGSSHFCSLTDIALGALRYAINAREDLTKGATAAALLNQLSPLCLRDARGKVEELSFFFSPKIVRVPTYLKIYKELHSFLTRFGLDCAQTPINVRTY